MLIGRCCFLVGFGEDRIHGRVGPLADPSVLRSVR